MYAMQRCSHNNAAISCLTDPSLNDLLSFTNNFSSL